MHKRNQVYFNMCMDYNELDQLHLLNLNEQVSTRPMGLTLSLHVKETLSER